MGKLLDFMGSKATTRHYLMMDGVDHTEMEPRLSQLMEMISQMDNVEIVHTTLDKYVEEVKKDIPELEIVKGELRNPAYRGINNQVLNDVLSSVVHLKQQNDKCERLLTGWVEPFSVMRELYGLGEYEKGFLKEAWRYLLMNQPHDSICGCSITPVHKDNDYRFDQVRGIGNELMEENFRDLMKEIDTSGFSEGYTVSVFNNGQVDYQGVTLIDVLVPGKLEYPSGLKRAANIHLYDGDGNAVPYQVVHMEKNRMKLSRPFKLCRTGYKGVP